MTWGGSRGALYTMHVVKEAKSMFQGAELTGTEEQMLRGDMLESVVRLQALRVS